MAHAFRLAVLSYSAFATEEHFVRKNRCSRVLPTLSAANSLSMRSVEKLAVR